MRAVALGIYLWFAASACGDAAPPASVDAGAVADGAAPDGGRPDGGARDSGPDSGFQWPVPTGSVAITRSAEWKNRISEMDRFVHDGDRGDQGEPTSPRWVKFAVVMRDPSKVYFQDSNLYPFHFEFVTRRLDPFVGRARAELDRVSLYEADQELILGAVLFPPTTGLAELGIQLVRQDAYHPEMARIVLDLVRRSVDTATNTQAFYFPTFEQDASARADQAFFSASGFPVGSADRWGTTHCYAEGWALGRLVLVPGADIEAAYSDGRLTAMDVLLTDGVPAEVPFVAGILSTMPVTPNSHAAILARSYQVPFAFIHGEAEQARIRGLAGREVLARIDGSFGPCEVRIVDAEGKVDPQQRAELLALKTPRSLTFPAKARRGAYSASTDELGPSDARHFGGKAANFGLLRESIPEASPQAIALSFDLWDDFMAQRPMGGRTLGEEIASRLALHREPLDVAALKAELASIRVIIREQATFPEALRSAVLAAIARYPAAERIRFRSSTNVEDGAEFTGAGLYDSGSGCLADDSDADAIGPSACDASEPNERGVFRAIQKVYASFYNDNAVLERIRRRVDESTVGMALLVHPSFVDVDELANGVVTLDWGTSFKRMSMVTQLGAVSVANPDGGARPEVVSVDSFGDNFYPSVTQRSTLVRLGATVMTFPEDYEALARLFLRVGERFASVAGRTDFTLDLEYKRVRPGRAVVKQVREVPRPDGSRMTPTFLLGDTVRRCTHQGESGDVWAAHRLKTRWTMTARSSWLSDTALSNSFYGEVVLERVIDGQVVQTSGPLPMRPAFSHTFDAQQITERWSDTGAVVALNTSLPRSVSSAQIPVLTPADAYLDFSAEWSTPVFELDFLDRPGTRTADYTRLDGCPEDAPSDEPAIRVDRDVQVGAKRARVGFFWPRGPVGISAGYTAPLRAWRETILEGFTAQPIVLRGYWSQTYRPGHHNFSEEFLFEPRLDPEVSAAQKDELERSGVRQIHVGWGSGAERIAVVGLDGSYRREQ